MFFNSFFILYFRSNIIATKSLSSPFGYNDCDESHYQPDSRHPTQHPSSSSNTIPGNTGNISGNNVIDNNRVMNNINGGNQGLNNDTQYNQFNQYPLPMPPLPPNVQQQSHHNNQQSPIGKSNFKD